MCPPHAPLARRAPTGDGARGGLQRLPARAAAEPGGAEERAGPAAGLQRAGGEPRRQGCWAAQSESASLPAVPLHRVVHAAHADMPAAAPLLHLPRRMAWPPGCPAHLPASCPAAPQLDAAVAELPDADVPIKRLLLLLDLARQGQPEEQPEASLERWAQVLRDLAVS